MRLKTQSATPTKNRCGNADFALGISHARPHLKTEMVDLLRCRGLPSLFGGCGLRTQPPLQIGLPGIQRIQITPGKNKKRKSTLI
jgi:hypothetical protein